MTQTLFPGTAMYLIRTASMLLPLLLASASCQAQDRPDSSGQRGVPPALRELRYSVPRGFTAAPALGDSATAVFTQRGIAVSVTALRGGTDRAAVIQRLRDVLTTVVPKAGTFRWRILTSSPVSPLDVYHERWIGYDGKEAAITEFHHLRNDARDVLVATTFSLENENAEEMFKTGNAPIASFQAREASARLVAELVGDPPFTETGFVGGPPEEGTPQGAQSRVVIESDFSGRGPPDADAPAHPDEAGVRAAFEAYRAALLARDGQAALPHVAAAVFEYYGDVQRLALYAMADEVRARPLHDQMFVLLLRHRLAPQRLRDMTPRELFAYGVDQGWIGEESTRRQQIDRVWVHGNMANVTINQGGRPSPLDYSFVRQEGAWKWDMLGVIQWMDPAFRMLADRNGLTPEALLVRVVEATNKGTVSPAIWDPPFAAPDRR
jgi:hypothetical protein